MGHFLVWKTHLSFDELDFSVLSAIHTGLVSFQYFIPSRSFSLEKLKPSVLFQGIEILTELCTMQTYANFSHYADPKYIAGFHLKVLFTSRVKGS